MIVNYRKIKKTKSLMHLDLATRVGSISNGAKDKTTKTTFLKWSLSTWFYFSTVTWFYFSGIVWIEE